MIVVEVVVACVIAWFAGDAYRSRASGWLALGDRFTSTRRVEGAVFRGRSAVLGTRWLAARYLNSLTVVVGEGALAISRPFPLRFGHPSLVIPWTAIAACQPVRFWGFPYVELRFRDIDRPWRFPGDVGRAIHDAWRAHRAGSVHRASAPRE